MSINACTINSETINSFCGARRQIILDRLIDELHPVVPPISGGGIGAGVGVRAGFNLPHPFEIDRTIVYELPDITVTVKLFGDVGIETQNVTGPRVDFVIVTHLEIGEPEQPIVVSVTDLRIE